MLFPPACAMFFLDVSIILSKKNYIILGLCLRLKGKGNMQFPMYKRLTIQYTDLTRILQRWTLPNQTLHAFVLVTNIQN